MKSVEELKRELEALAPARPNEQIAQSSQKEHTDTDAPSGDYLDFGKFPITDAEQAEFDDAVAALNRRRYGTDTDPDPDDPHSWLALNRAVTYMLRRSNNSTWDKNVSAGKDGTN